MSNPLLEPIHGVSLFDYATVTAKMAAGVDQASILKALGIETAVFEEASTLWVARMQEDGTFEVSKEFGAFFGQADSHPKLSGLKAEVSAEGQANLEKLRTDRYFYEELCGARQAAYAYGLDGAQWIQDNFGINLGDFQSVAMVWMQQQPSGTSEAEINEILHYNNYQQEKEKEYAARFAQEQGGNVADDVEF